MADNGGLLGGGRASLARPEASVLGLFEVTFKVRLTRKAGRSPFLREWIVPFGRSGHVALFEIQDEANVAVLAVRHQLEDDYH